MPAGTPQFIAEVHRFEQGTGAFRHFFLRPTTQPPHRYHHIFLRTEVLHQKMELENKSDEFIAFAGKLVVTQM